MPATAARRRPASCCACRGRLQDFSVTAVGKDDKLEMALKAAYAANKYNVVATMGQSGKVRW